MTFGQPIARSPISLPNFLRFSVKKSCRTSVHILNNIRSNETDCFSLVAQRHNSGLGRLIV